MKVLIIGHIFIIIYFVLLFSSEISSSDEYSYKAAVLEYSPNFVSGEENVSVYEKSVPEFIEYIQKAAAENVDIIVFPEGGLTVGVPMDRNQIRPFTTEIPDPTDKIAPCNSKNFGQHLRNISCAAAQNKIYVAMNLIELYDCTGDSKCSDDGVFIYNTNIVLDRNGVVIARYRKYNLFVEPVFDVTDEPQLTTFDTDFNVTFGMFICFDILFQKPALELVRKQSIHDFIFSASWLSELPFLTAVQTQIGWAYSNRVTLLASGYNYPREERGGSGIYFGELGALAQIFPLSRLNIMIVAKIPKYPFYEHSNLEKQSEFFLQQPDEIVLGQEDLKNYTTKVIDKDDFTENLCDGKLCCNFEIKSEVTMAVHYIYRVVVLDGIRTYPDLVKGGLQVCGIVSCLNETIQSCGLRNRSAETGYIFENIRIRGNFIHNENTFQWPSILSTDLLPYNPKSFKFIISNDNVELSLTESVDNLLTFAIHGRNYTLDERIDK